MFPKRRRLSTKLPLLLLSTLITEPVFANPVVAVAAPEACGEFNGFSGNVQLLDSSRSDFQGIEKGGVIRCGDWIGTEEGAVDFKLASGPRVIVGPRTFLQVLSSASMEQDPIVLYRGEIFVDSRKATSVVSANARLRIQSGKAVVLFVEDSNETQVVNLDGKMSFENRFLTDRPMELAAGFVSMFGANRERSVPNDPRIADATSLEKHLKTLEVPSDLREKVVAQAKARAKTQTVVRLGEGDKSSVAVETRPAASTGSGRMPASVSHEKPSHDAPAPSAHHAADHEEKIERVPAAHKPKRAAKPVVEAKTAQKTDLLKRLSEIDPEVDSE